MRRTEAESIGQLDAERVRVRVLDPDAQIPTVELDRLFGTGLSAARWRGLLACPRIVASCGPRIVGLAAYEHLPGEIRVPEFGIDPNAPCGLSEAASVMLEALELACLARGARRLVLTSRASVAGAALWQRGYSRIGDGANSWLQKELL